MEVIIHTMEVIMDVVGEDGAAIIDIK
jgi:hypothetical protein